MVKVQEKKQTVAMYFKQASRAGEGFGNRSSPRFREPNPTLVGPGKYKSEGARTKSDRTLLRAATTPLCQLAPLTSPALPAQEAWPAEPTPQSGLAR